MGTQTGIRHPLTADALAEFPDDGFQYELDDGELIMMPLDGEEHGRIEADIVGLLYAEVKKRRLGRLYSSDTGFVLREDPDIVRSPDVSFRSQREVSAARHVSGFYPWCARSGSGGPVAFSVTRRPQSEDTAISRQRRRHGVGDLPSQEGGCCARFVWCATKTVTLDGFLEAPRILPGVRIALRDVFEPSY